MTTDARTIRTEDRIREYWSARAEADRSTPAATTRDVHLRELEIRTVIRALRMLGPRSRQRVLDVGCGDGYSTLRVARAFPDLQFLGIDYSPAMIRSARAGLRAGAAANLSYREADVLALDEALGDARFQFAVSDRCLINLPTLEAQTDAIRRIAGRIPVGGHYVAIENFLEGHDAMNDARAAVGLPPIPVRWHNRYFRESEFLQATRSCFELVALEDFTSAYIFATRVVYSKMCAMRGDTPDYDHAIHRLAVDLPATGRFGATKMAILRRTNPAPSEERR